MLWMGETRKEETVAGTDASVRGQVVRVALLALQNLLAAPGLDLAPEMVEAALPKVVQQRLLQVHFQLSAPMLPNLPPLGLPAPGQPGTRLDDAILPQHIIYCRLVQERATAPAMLS